jgi:DNA-binding Lrp family transcriptional regulator
MILNTCKKYSFKAKRGIFVSTGEISEAQAMVLKELIVDGRKSVADIAKDNGFKKETVQKNIDELEKMGVIKGATIHVNYKNFGYKAVAHLLVNVESNQSEQLEDYLRKTPDIYFFYSHGPKGNIDITVTIKSLRELDEVKDSIKRHFSVSEIKTVIWTDIKEMHNNMTIGRHIKEAPSSQHRNISPKRAIVDEIDQKIADILAENGRVPIETIARELKISPDTAKRRYEKLKKNGTLKVTIQFDPTKIGYHALGIFFAVTSNGTSSAIIDTISKIPDVISIMKTTGNYELQIYAVIKNIDQLLSIQDTLGKISGISKIDTEILSIPNKWPSPRQCISTF